MNISTQPSQRPSRLAADLKWSAVELVRITERLSQTGNDLDAQTLHRMIKMVQIEEAKVNTIAEDVAGRISP
jgi:hypothetical protein